MPKIGVTIPWPEVCVYCDKVRTLALTFDDGSVASVAIFCPDHAERCVTLLPSELHAYVTVLLARYARASL